MNQTTNHLRESQDLSTIVKALQHLLLSNQHDEESTKPLVLTAKDAADELQISLPTFRDHFLCRPDFPKIRAGTKYLIPREAFVEWLNGQS